MTKPQRLAAFYYFASKRLHKLETAKVIEFPPASRKNLLRLATGPTARSWKRWAAVLAAAQSWRRPGPCSAIASHSAFSVTNCRAPSALSQLLSPLALQLDAKLEASTNYLASSNSSLRGCCWRRLFRRLFRRRANTSERYGRLQTRPSSRCMFLVWVTARYRVLVEESKMPRKTWAEGLGRD